MKAKKLDSDEVGATSCWTDRGQHAAALRRSASRDFTRSEKKEIVLLQNLTSHCALTVSEGSINF